MHCPSCAVEMDAPTLEGHLGTEVQIDLCRACQIFWFDRFESLRLAPGATLRLFQIIGERSRSAPPRLNEPLKCPRCGLRLLATHDRQRNTPFHYWRCGREHGRLITFFDFLREKDFIRPLSPQQLVELRQNVQMITCSGCGAPIDLVHASACAHCGAPISMLDLKHIADMSAQPSAAAASRPPIDGTLVFQLLKRAEHADSARSPDLIDAGLQWLVSWLAR